MSNVGTMICKVCKQEYDNLFHHIDQKERFHKFESDEPSWTNADYAIKYRDFEVAYNRYKTALEVVKEMTAIVDKIKADDLIPELYHLANEALAPAKDEGKRCTFNYYGPGRCKSFATRNYKNCAGGWILCKLHAQEVGYKPQKAGKRK